jgi:hypothetical protein
VEGASTLAALVGRPTSAADVDGTVAGKPFYHDHRPAAGGRTGHVVVAEEAEVLWTSAPPGACFALARGGGGLRWWRRPELDPRQPEQG